MILTVIMESEFGSCYFVAEHIIRTDAQEPPILNASIDSYQILFQFLIDKLRIIQDFLEILFGVVI